MLDELQTLQTFPYRNFISYKLRQWLGRNRITSPESYKHWLLKFHAKKFKLKVLIETGTAFGDTLASVYPYFDQLHSIELDQNLFHKAVLRFSSDFKITCHQGDSAFMLAEILQHIDQPCLFWLDAHAMVGGVVGYKTTPIMEELSSIVNHHRTDHIILIDDARLFGKGSYPELAEVERLTRRQWNNARMTIKNDVIRIYNVQSD